MESENYGFGLPELWTWSPRVIELKYKSYGVGIREIWRCSMRVIELQSEG